MKSTVLQLIIFVSCYQRVEKNTPVENEPKFVIQYCKHCKGKPFTWKSQPYHPVLGRNPTGNILLSFAVLLAGASISKVLLGFRHMGLCAYTLRTYLVHQKK